MDNENEAIVTDVESSLPAGDGTRDGAVEALLKRWEDPKETSASEESDDDASTEADDTVNADGDTDSTDDSGDVEGDDTDRDDDSDEGDEDVGETTIQVKVDGELHDVPVKDLQRAWGLEKSLNRKTEEVAVQRKEIEEKAQYYEAGLQQMFQAAQQRFEPYAQIDWAVAAKEMDTEDFKALREEAQRTYQEVQFFGNSVQEYVQQRTAQVSEQLKQAATEALVELKRDIPNFDQKKYREIADYAVSQGMPAEVVSNLVDAAALKLIWKAKQFDAGQSVATRKKSMTPKRTVSSGSSNGNKSPDKRAAAVNRLKQSGSRDDAIAALMAGWAKDK